MIRGIHGLFYSSKPEELRAFIRDKLKLAFTDIHDGWLIFDFQEGDLGVHPTDGEEAISGHHNISFFTDDLESTVTELQGRGVKFDDEVADHGYGLVTHLTMPGGVKVQLYQPKYQKKSQKKSLPMAKPAKVPRAPAKKAATVQKQAGQAPSSPRARRSRRGSASKRCERL